MGRDNSEDEKDQRQDPTKNRDHEVAPALDLGLAFHRVPAQFQVVTLLLLDLVRVRLGPLLSLEEVKSVQQGLFVLTGLFPRA